MSSVAKALEALRQLGFPRAQLNERSALTLLSLLALKSGDAWTDAKSPMIGVTPIMGWIRDHYGKDYKANTRESVRKETLHQFLDGGLVLRNPDKTTRPVNSPATVYQVSPAALALLKSFGGKRWNGTLRDYRRNVKALTAIYAAERKMLEVPVTSLDGSFFSLSPGEHSQLIKDIVETFAPRHAQGAVVLYLGDTGAKHEHFEREALEKLGVLIDKRGKLPDVVLYDGRKNWLFLIEAVTERRPSRCKAPRRIADAIQQSLRRTCFRDRISNPGGGGALHFGPCVGDRSVVGGRAQSPHPFQRRQVPGTALGPRQRGELGAAGCRSQNRRIDQSPVEKTAIH